MVDCAGDSAAGDPGGGSHQRERIIAQNVTRPELPRRYTEPNCDAGPETDTSSDRPNPSGCSGASREIVPDDFLREASTRLGIMSLVAAGLWVVGTILGRLAMRSMQAGDSKGLDLTMGDAIAAASVLASLLLFAYTRTANRDPRRILDLGLVYMVLTALALGLTFHSGPILPTLSVSPQISWIGAVVLMFSAIVPSTRTKTLLAGLIAVSMNPVGMLWARAQGYWDFGPASNALLMHYPDYLLVGVAVVISHVVTTLGRQVAKAREMGSYQLGELLGRGGMGEVYKASHRMLARPAAIKLIRPEMLGRNDPAVAARTIARFRREAEAAAQLRSPHTVDLYDFGVTEDQTLYLVMEFLDGMDLESLVRQHGPMPAPRVIHVLRQVCDSLDEAHARGLVHRDIKPANIHLGRVGCREDFVKVLDFGLVKTAAVGAEPSLATIEGVIMGTPAYMAPEMALGDGRGWARRSVCTRMCGLLPAHRRASVYGRHAAQGDHTAPAGGAGAAIGADGASDPGGARTTGAGLSRQETGRPTADRTATGAVTRRDRGDDVGRGRGGSLVEAHHPPQVLRAPGGP